MAQDYLGAAQKLFGDTSGFDIDRFEEQYGKYFDPYDTAREENLMLTNAMGKKSLMESLGVSMKNMRVSAGKSGLAFNGGFGVASNQLQKQARSEMALQDTRIADSIYELRDDYKQNMYDMLVQLADSVVGGLEGATRSFGRDDEPTGGGRTRSTYD